MSDRTDSSGTRVDPLSDLISIVAGPIAAGIRSFDQLRKGIDELMRGMENFNSTMDTLNDTALRVNRLLGDFEEPVRALMPQVTRTLQTADEITSRLAGPMDQVIPGLDRLAETLNSPVIAALPHDLSTFLDAINDLVRRMSPLGQLADSAGGLFGLKLPGMSRPAPTPAAATSAPSQSPAKPQAKKSAAKKAAARKTPPTRR